jgi:sec-independent protein translocase protein TatB
VLSLSPIKILIVLVVVLLVVGPDKLPQIARQIGGAWKTFRGFTTKVEAEVRSTMPDLPSTGDIARFARSPVALLDSLANLDGDGLKPDPLAEAAAPSAEGALQVDPSAPVQGPPAPPRRPSMPPGGYDPSLN